MKLIRRLFANNAPLVKPTVPSTTQVKAATSMAKANMENLQKAEERKTEMLVTQQKTQAENIRSNVLGVMAKSKEKIAMANNQLRARELERGRVGKNLGMFRDESKPTKPVGMPKPKLK